MLKQDIFILAKEILKIVYMCCMKHHTYLSLYAPSLSHPIAGISVSVSLLTCNGQGNLLHLKHEELLFYKIMSLNHNLLYITWISMKKRCTWAFHGKCFDFSLYWPLFKCMDFYLHCLFDIFLQNWVYGSKDTCNLGYVYCCCSCSVCCTHNL